jgi:hypothetical protein
MATMRPDPNERCPGCEQVPEWQHGELDEDGEGLWWHSCVRAGDVKGERAVRRMLGETDLEPRYLAECERCGHTIDNLSETDATAVRVETCETCGEPWTITRYE